jgi:hypothetical protein
MFRLKGFSAFLITALLLSQANATTLFSNIGTSLYDGGGLNLFHGDVGPSLDVPFIASVSGSIFQIDIAAYHSRGPDNDLTVAIYTSNSGSLGAILGSWLLFNMPAPTDQSLAFPVYSAISGISGVELSAGESYYLALTAFNDPADVITVVDNNIKSGGQILPLPTGNWTLPAFDILSSSSLGDNSAGNAVPEPSTSAIIILGFCCLVSVRQVCRKRVGKGFYRCRSLERPDRFAESLTHNISLI